MTQTHMKTRLGMNPRSTEPEKTYEVNTTPGRMNLPGRSVGRAGGPPDNTTSEETEEDVTNKSEIKQAVKKTSQTGWAQPGLGSIYTGGCLFPRSSG